MAKRKNTKKSKKNIEKIESVGSFDTDIWSKLFTIFGVLAFLLVFYLLTLYITNKNSDGTKEEEKTGVNISYDTTIVGRALSMGDDEYMVIFYDYSNEDIASTYSDLVSNYTGGLKIYSVDMSKGFNKPYSTNDTSNKSPETESDFLINGPTLIKVNNGKVSDYLEGQDAISEYLS